ncbi:MAG: anthranilate synthase component I [Gammaproteobacteria bacterium]|nr:anthranilate synthase component I [Gammaproteobacteria bacterium]
MKLDVAPRRALTRTLLTDGDTALGLYQRLDLGAGSFLFESVQGGEKWGRYSIIGLPAQRRIRVEREQVFVETGEVVESFSCADPLTWLTQVHQAYAQATELAGLPRFAGGLVGYWGYDAVRWMEPRLQGKAPPDSLAVPDIYLFVADEVLVVDNLSGLTQIILHVNDDADSLAAGERRLNSIAQALTQPMPKTHSTSLAPIDENQFVSSFGEQAFEDAVRRIQEYILAGDVMQVVISQRMSVPYQHSSLSLYRALRHLNPSPYLFYVDFGSFQVVGSSPEILVRVADGEVTVRPIAGTRKRGVTPAQDLANEQDLLADPKEIAEHLMLIDLGRNDVGRISEAGSVQLTEKMIIEKYSHVMHIVSNVTGKLRPEVTAMEALKAAFPAGTLSGAPKIRAMEIIDELEPVKRGVYGGAVGYWSWSGEMDVAIAIRTAVVKDQTLYMQAGAGVVADSVPQSEWQETLSKSRAIFKAAQLVSEGLYGAA